MLVKSTPGRLSQCIGENALWARQLTMILALSFFFFITFSLSHTHTPPLSLSTLYLALSLSLHLPLPSLSPASSLFPSLFLSLSPLFFPLSLTPFYPITVTIYPGNTEQGKCRLTNEYLFFLFFIGRWYYEKNILSL